MASRDDVGPILNGIPTHLPDIDPDETHEWLEASTRSSTAPAGRAPAT